LLFISRTIWREKEMAVIVATKAGKDTCRRKGRRPSLVKDEKNARKQKQCFEGKEATK
jgi:hypothetical protein